MILRMNRFFVAGLKSSGRGVIITFSRIPIEDKICKKKQLIIDYNECPKLRMYLSYHLVCNYSHERVPGLALFVREELLILIARPSQIQRPSVRPILESPPRCLDGWMEKD